MVHCGWQGSAAILRPMTMRATTEQYYEDAKKQAVDLFNHLHPRAAHGLNLTMDSAEIGRRIDALPGDTLLQAALADLWLRLSQKEGMDRRKVSPPPSPFRKIAGRGNAKWASKADILAWDAAWRLRETASQAAQKLLQSGSTKVASAASVLQRKLLWLVENGDVLGWIEDLEVEAFGRAKVADLDIRSWTLYQALQRPWRNPQEQRLWVSRYRAGNRLLEAEVGRLALTALARPRTDKVVPPAL